MSATLKPLLGMAGYGVRHPDDPTIWIADGYDTPEDAVEAAEFTLGLLDAGHTLDDALIAAAEAHVS